MKKKSLFLCSMLLMLWILATAPLHAEGQESEVTFYSNGPVRIGVSLISRVAFSGEIFDGSTKLVYLKHGHFVTLRLTSGQHTFAASLSSRPASNSDLTINLESGQHYFIRTMADVKHAFVFRGAKGVLERVDCSTANEEASKTTGVDLNDIAASVQIDIKPSSAFPSCQ